MTVASERRHLMDDLVVKEAPEWFWFGHRGEVFCGWGMSMSAGSEALPACLVGVSKPFVYACSRRFARKKGFFDGN